jgi:predicted RNase H-like HicB family nuclease
MNITFETERETDGRWIAEVPELPGVMAYGLTEREAIGHAEALALRALAEQIENGETLPMSIQVHIAAE